jgi:hypothetical protein
MQLTPRLLTRIRHRTPYSCVLITPTRYNYETYTVYHYTHPNKPIMGGESASCTSDRGYYLPTNATSGHVYADDDGCVQSAWQSIVSQPWAR